MKVRYKRIQERIGRTKIAHHGLLFPPALTMINQNWHHPCQRFLVGQLTLPQVEHVAGKLKMRVLFGITLVLKEQRNSNRRGSEVDRIDQIGVMLS